MDKIWLINHYATSMYVNKGGRHYYMAKHLKNMGFDPLIICSNTFHTSPKKIKETEDRWFDVIDENGIQFVFINARCYTGNGKKRVLNIWDFYRNIMGSYREIVNKFGRPSVVLGSSIHPLAPIAALKISKRIKSKCICEFRDLWPDELIAMGSVHEKSVAAKVLRSIEHYTFKNADALIFTMEGAPEYIRANKWAKESGGDVDLNKVHYINNGVDIAEYEKNRRENILDDEDLLDNSIYKIIYTGSIRKANGVDFILDVAKKMKEYEDICFFLYGDGDETIRIQNRIEEEKIKNVKYKGRVNKKYIPFVLSKGNINLLIYLNGNLFRYGCSNNKLFEYIASKKPILCNVRMNYSIIEKYHCGMEIQSDDIEAFVRAIMDIYQNKELVDSYRQNAETAIGDFVFFSHTKKLVEIIKSLEN